MPTTTPKNQEEECWHEIEDDPLTRVVEEEWAWRDHEERND